MGKLHLGKLYRERAVTGKMSITSGEAPQGFFSLKSVTYGEVTSEEALQGTGSDWKNVHTDKQCSHK